MLSVFSDNCEVKEAWSLWSKALEWNPISLPISGLVTLSSDLTYGDSVHKEQQNKGIMRHTFSMAATVPRLGPVLLDEHPLIVDVPMSHLQIVLSYSSWLSMP